MKRRTAIVLALAAVFGLLLVAGPAIAANGSVSIKESDERYAYTPKTVYVNVGESVTWTNDSDAPHTVDSDTGDEMESGNFTEDQTFEHTFDATGTFAYHCDIHDYMKGTVVVLAAGVTAPPTNTAPASTAPSEPTWLGILVIVMAGLAAGGLALRRVRVRAG
jgi:plastocyanin